MRMYVCSLPNIGVKLEAEQAEKIHDQLGIVLGKQAKIRAFPSRVYLMQIGRAPHFF